MGQGIGFEDGELEVLEYIYDELLTDGREFYEIDIKIFIYFMT